MFYKINLTGLLLMVILCGCNNKQRQIQQVMALQEMNELATVEYIVTKIIRANDNKTWYKIGDRKILMSCKATLTAGIDLSKLSKDDIHIEGKNIEIILPHSTLVSLNIKPEDITTEYEETGVMRQSFNSEERNALAIQAENQVREGVESLGILETAETNAALFIHNFLTKLGFTKTNIRFQKAGFKKN